MTTRKISLLVLLVMILAGCNTMAGLGKDVKKVGEKLDNAAEDCGDAGGCRD